MAINYINKKIIILSLLVCCIFTFTGCGKKEIPEDFSKLISDKSGKVVRLGFYGSPELINPIKAAEYEYDKMICNLIFASPLRKLETGDYVPYLFETFETELEGENLVVKAKWKQGLKWHDGVGFNPNEFEFNVEQMKLPDNNSPYSDSAKEIISINNQAENIEIKFSGNSKKYFDLLCAGILPGHILSKEKIASNTVEEVYKNFEKNPIGLGPYKLVNNNKFKYLHLEPVSDFFDGKGGKRPQIAIICSYELQQTISDFREDLFDWISAPSSIADQLKNLGIENVVYIEYPNPAVLTWAFNMKNEKLSDIKIRRALNLIIDRNIITNTFGSGVIELFDNLVPLDGNKKTDKEKLEEGKKLLDEAGIKDTNNDGIREYKGNNYKINILINNDSMPRKLIAEKIIERLKTVGIEAEIQAVSWNVFISEKLKKGDFETALFSYHISKDCSLKSLFATKKDGDNSSLNITGLSDEELDRNIDILDSAITTANKAESLKIVNEKLSQYCPCAFLIRTCNLGMIHGNQVNTIKAKVSFWDDIFNWKLMFGNDNSKL
jgi:peptide/nickel transport system substrate-binding protein